MSFSYDVKTELCRVNARHRHCALAELAGIVHMCGVVSLGRDGAGIQVTTEHSGAAARISALAGEAYQADCELLQTRRQLKREFFTVKIAHGNISDMLSSLALSLSRGIGVNAARFSELTKRQCCKAAYVRGAFLGGGSITSPNKLYHMEFVAGSEPPALLLARLLTELGIQAKYIARKESHVVYTKDAESIARALTIMGAHVSVLELENIRIVKSIRNTVNRQVNWENANIDKTVRSAMAQIENIRVIEACLGFDKLSAPLREAAELRLSNPEASLSELAALSRNTSRSGMNNRLRRLSDIAFRLKEEEGEDKHPFSGENI